MVDRKRYGRVEEYVRAVARAKLTDVFQFQWTSNESLEGHGDEMGGHSRISTTPPLGDGARETLREGPGNEISSNIHDYVLHRPGWYCVSAWDQCLRTTVGLDRDTAHAESYQRDGVIVCLL